MTPQRTARIIRTALAASVLCAFPPHLAGRSHAMAQVTDPATPPPANAESITTLHVTARLVVLDVVVTREKGPTDRRPFS
jgi:hypothetical protein